jgi:TonB family protein
VILPNGARDWSDDRMRVVLLHELSHIQRGDWLTQMTAQCLGAVYWFNPLVWLAARRLRLESEHACDDAVLNGGFEGSEYAAHLLELARAARSERRMWMPAPAMARPSSLERRFTAMLSRHRNRGRITRRARLITVMVTVSTAVLVAAVGLAQTFSTFSGTALDPTNRFLPGVTLALTNVQTGAKHEVQTNQQGRFEFVGLPPGNYAWAAQLPGFATLEGSITVVGSDVQQNIGLQVGSLQETITVVGSSKPSVATTSNPRIDVEGFRQKELSRICAGGRGKPGTGAEIGGNLKAPRKLADFRPRYPERLIASNIGGVVVLDAIIDTEGDVRLVSVVSSPHPDLAAAAEDAVRQWRFSSTILNCTAVEVAMRVTANFRIDQ